MRALLVIFGKFFLDIVQYRLRSPCEARSSLHRSSRSPFPAGERLMVRSSFFDIQRTSFATIILFGQFGIFY